MGFQSGLRVGIKESQGENQPQRDNSEGPLSSSQRQAKRKVGLESGLGSSCCHWWHRVAEILLSPTVPPPSLPSQYQAAPDLCSVLKFIFSACSWHCPAVCLLRDSLPPTVPCKDHRIRLAAHPQSTVLCSSFNLNNSHARLTLVKTTLDRYISSVESSCRICTTVLLSSRGLFSYLPISLKGAINFCNRFCKHRRRPQRDVAAHSRALGRQHSSCELHQGETLFETDIKTEIERQRQLQKKTKVEWQR